MKTKYVARLYELGDVEVKDKIRTTTDKRYTHAVIGFPVSGSHKGDVLGWYEDEFTAHAAAAENWRPFPNWHRVVVVPVTGHPVR